MNPSASGWIRKHLPVFQKEILDKTYSENEFYDRLRTAGFIYANSISTLSYPDGTIYQLNLDEISKINLFDSLGYVYFSINPEKTHEEFIKATNAYYTYLKKHTWFSFRIPGFRTLPDTKLEKVIQSRIQTNDSIFRKNFSSILTNALLYLDVLTFKHYLNTDKVDPAGFAKALEAVLANTVYLAFKQKSSMETHEKLVLKLLETSLRYNTIEEADRAYEELDYSLHQHPLERQYIMDLACMTVFADEIIDPIEEKFITTLGGDLGFAPEAIKEAQTKAQTFLKTNREKIGYLDYSSPFKNLYDNTFSMVRTLILRNKKRLTQEIRGSGELVVLLGKSASADLSPVEREKVKTQLLDICKIVPSLGIFLLPGGSILLPILIKLIPDLLPSAFNDNRIDEQAK